MTFQGGAGAFARGSSPRRPFCHGVVPVAGSNRASDSGGQESVAVPAVTEGGVAAQPSVGVTSALGQEGVWRNVLPSVVYQQEITAGAKKRVASVVTQVP